MTTNRKYPTNHVETTDVALSEAIEMLTTIANIRKNDGTTFANQGQAMDGFSLLANYNSAADKIITFLEPDSELESE